MTSIFGSVGLPHGVCFLWNPALLSLHVISDSIIALAYFLIPVVLLRIVRKRGDVPFNWIFFCFGAFVIACGITHVMEVVTLWHPIYWISGIIKAITAVISVITLLLLIGIAPAILAIPHRLADRKFRHLIEHAPDAILQVDKQGRIVLANRTAEQLFGYTRAELLDLNVDSLVPEASRAGHPKRREDFLHAGVSRPMGAAGVELFARRKDGSRVPVEISLSTIQSEAGPNVAAVIRDVTDRKRAEQELRKTHQNLDSVLDSTLVSVIALDSDWNINYLNKTAKTVLHIEGDLVGTRLWAAFPEQAPQSREKLIQVMETRQPVAYESYYAPLDLTINTQVHPWDNGGITIFFTDISEPKRLQRELDRERVRREQRIEALGNMAGGLAHEISNPLGIIQARASDLAEMAEQSATMDSADVTAACTSIVKTSDRAMRILRGLRMFAREGSRDPLQSVTILSLAEQTVDLVRSRYEAHSIRLEIDVPSGLPPIECREVQISQILLNLLNNAFDAINSTPVPERWVKVTANLEPKGPDSREPRMCIDVIDSGPGVMEEHRSHVMEAFYTTKPLGGGMGVGLSLCKAIAEDHGGTLSLTAFDGHTCFRLKLPLHPAQQNGVAL